MDLVARLGFYFWKFQFRYLLGLLVCAEKCILIVWDDFITSSLMQWISAVKSFQLWKQITSLARGTTFFSKEDRLQSFTTGAENVLHCFAEAVWLHKPIDRLISACLEHALKACICISCVALCRWEVLCADLYCNAASFFFLSPTSLFQIKIFESQLFFFRKKEPSRCNDFRK